MDRNYISRNLSATTSFSDRVVSTLGFSAITGIQNNTTGEVIIKFNGGDGELRIPAGVLFEPYRPIIGSFSIRSTVAGNVCLVG